VIKTGSSTLFLGLILSKILKKEISFRENQASGIGRASGCCLKGRKVIVEILITAREKRIIAPIKAGSSPSNKLL
jgi:hypothetical protein